jgi:hypothetical protein
MASISPSTTSSSSSLTTTPPTSPLSSEPEPWRASTSRPLPLGALLDICDDIWFDIFTEWLPITAVCDLDTALCQKSRRPEFLRIISSKVLLFYREEINILAPHTLCCPTHRPIGAAELDWILKRGIHLASLHLKSMRDHTDAAKAEKERIRIAVASLALNGSLDKLETISFAFCFYIEDADLEAVLSKCYRSVKSIDIRGCKLNADSSLIKRCTKLEALAPRGHESVAEIVEIFTTCRKVSWILLTLHSFLYIPYRNHITIAAKALRNSIVIILQRNRYTIPVA